MVNEAPGPINFTMFLTIFGDRAQGNVEQTCLPVFLGMNERFSHISRMYLCLRFLSQKES